MPRISITVSARTSSATLRVFRGVFEDLFGQVRRRADADEVGVANGLEKLCLRQRLPVVFDVGVAVVAEDLHRAGVDSFHQEDTDSVLVEAVFV
jgi:hypothetical protein